VTTEPLEIGVKLRHARKVRGLRLRDLADRIGCSESLLSKIENDKVRPSLKILHAIVTELETTIAHLFTTNPTDGEVVMRKGTRQLISLETVSNRENAGITVESLVPEPTGHLLCATIHLVEPGGATDGVITHKGEEVGYVLDGELELTVADKVYRIKTGDSFFFSSDQPHGYRNPGKKTTRIIWVNTPPTF